MFGPRRRGIPFAGLFLFAGGFALASLAGGATSAISFIFFLPLLMLKIMFMFFAFGMLMRFAGAGFGRSRGWRGPSGYDSGDVRGRHAPAPPREPSQEEKDWAEARRAAQREIDELFPDQPE